MADQRLLLSDQRFTVDGTLIGARDVRRLLNLQKKLVRLKQSRRTMTTSPQDPGNTPTA